MPGALPPTALTRWLEPVEAALRAAVPSDGAQISAAARYVMGWEGVDGRPTSAGGKRIRPGLALAAAHALAGDAGASAALPGAVAVELIHNFSLVHDDIQDHDAERHGRPSAWALYGEAQAMNLGDHLHVLAIRALSEAPAPAAERRLRALAVLNQATSEMIGGQWRDISFESETAVSLSDYLAMVGGKTAALIAAPLEIGAILAGTDEPTARGFGEWGRALGLAFQAHDDYLGIWGDSLITGKSNRADVLRRKKSLPIVAGLADAGAAPVIRAAYAQPEMTPALAAEVVAALEGCGAHETARAFAHDYTLAADATLASLPIPDEARRGFREIAAYLVDRVG